MFKSSNGYGILVNHADGIFVHNEDGERFDISPLDVYPKRKIFYVSSNNLNKHGFKKVLDNPNNQNYNETFNNVNPKKEDSKMSFNVGDRVVYNGNPLNFYPEEHGMQSFYFCHGMSGVCVGNDTFRMDAYPDLTFSGIEVAMKRPQHTPNTPKKEKNPMNYSFTIRNNVQYDEELIKKDLTVQNPLALITRTVTEPYIDYEKRYVKVKGADGKWILNSKGKPKKIEKSFEVIKNREVKRYHVIVLDKFLWIARAKNINPPVDEPSKPYNFQNWITWATKVKKAPFTHSTKEVIDVTIPNIDQGSDNAYFEPIDMGFRDVYP